MSRVRSEAVGVRMLRCGPYRQPRSLRGYAKEMWIRLFRYEIEFGRTYATMGCVLAPAPEFDALMGVEREVGSTVGRECDRHVIEGGGPT